MVMMMYLNDLIATPPNHPLLSPPRYRFCKFTAGGERAKGFLERLLSKVYNSVNKDCTLLLVTFPGKEVNQSNK